MYIDFAGKFELVQSISASHSCLTGKTLPARFEVSSYYQFGCWVKAHKLFAALHRPWAVQGQPESTRWYAVTSIFVR